MPLPSWPGPPRPDVPNRAKDALLQAKGKLPSGALQAAKARGDAVLSKLQSSPLSAQPVVQAIQEYIKELLARGQDPDELLKKLKDKAEQELASRQHVIRFLSDALNLVRAKDTQMKLLAQVLRPARTRQISSAEASARLTDVLMTPWPFLSWAEQRVGSLTIGVALQAEGGLAVGVGATEGLSGLRYSCLCHSIGGSVCTGAVAELDLGAQLSASLGPPEAGTDVSVEVTVGGGYNATVGVTAAFTPIPRTPTFQEPDPFTYEFKGLAVSLGVGTGFDIGLAVGVTRSSFLLGMVT